MLKGVDEARLRRNSRLAAIGTIVGATVAFIAVGASVFRAKTATDEFRLEEKQRIDAQDRVKVVETAVNFGIQSEAKLAASLLGTEVGFRWNWLEHTAADGELCISLFNANETSTIRLNDEVQAPLQEWLSRAAGNYDNQEAVSSWFILGSDGRLLARLPVEGNAEKEIGKSFRNRDHFHGQGVDLGYNDAQSAAPIKKSHRSAPFKSRVTGELMIAFTTPVSCDSNVLGVFGMTAAASGFRSLERSQVNNLLVLLDAKTAIVDGTEERGVVLHHPQLTTNPDGITPIIALEPSVAARLQELQQGVFIEDYQDPVTASSLWKAAIEPVVVMRKGGEQETGLFAVVQAEAPD